jgi:hypothetical protein
VPVKLARLELSITIRDCFDSRPRIDSFYQYAEKFKKVHDVLLARTIAPGFLKSSGYLLVPTLRVAHGNTHI